MNIQAAIAPHAHRIRLEQVWGGYRARIDGNVVCNRGSSDEALAYAQQRLYGMLVEAQRAQAQQAAWQMWQAAFAMMWTRA